jgi:riboflavin synthase
MFTGIVGAVGRVQAVEQRDQGIRANIACDGFDLSDVSLGDSIAVNGVCLTVVAKTPRSFAIDISQETLRCATGLDRVGAEVNLEKALRLSDRLGGHLVSGHVDGIGEVLSFAQAGESWALRVRLQPSLAKFAAAKGSVTINGVSLTINQVDSGVISVNLIPHTLTVTTLKHLQTGTGVNIEVDMIARYVAQLMAHESHPTR